jgi:hypothetical protein
MPLQPCYGRTGFVDTGRKREEIALTARDAQLLSQDACAAVTAATLLERLDLDRAGGAWSAAADPIRRAAMREYLPDIAWETEVWVADAPSHLIHFNGERFLGPYPER